MGFCKDCKWFIKDITPFECTNKKSPMSWILKLDQEGILKNITEEWGCTCFEDKPIKRLIKKEIFSCEECNNFSYIGKDSNVKCYCNELDETFMDKEKFFKEDCILPRG